MKQSVNLYLPEFRKKKEWLDAERMLKVFAGFAGFMLLFAGVERLQLWSVRSELADVVEQRDAERAATTALINSFGIQEEDKALVDENRQMVDELNSLEAVLKYLSGVELGNTRGFSPYLIELAQYHTRGIRFTQINIEDSGVNITLQGEMSSSGGMLLYMENLKLGDAFKGKSFDLSVEATTLLGDEANRLQEMAAWNFFATTKDEGVSSAGL